MNKPLGHEPNRPLPPRVSATVTASTGAHMRLSRWAGSSLVYSEPGRWILGAPLPKFSTEYVNGDYSKSEEQINNGDMIRTVTEVGRMTGGALSECIFCQIATSSTSTTLLHSDDKVVAFQDINPSAFRHYLVIPKQHIPTVKNLQRSSDDFSLGKGQSTEASMEEGLRFTILAASCKYCFEARDRENSCNDIWFPSASIQQCRSPPPPLLRASLYSKTLNSWRFMKYLSLGPLGGFIEVEKLLERIKPPIIHPSSM
uniref:HIT domain-containing protein n=1 Tax=Solanum lycopersicum TaxID=4081 RepID=A0A3Q7HHW4_SOLLC